MSYTSPSGPCTVVGLTHIKRTETMNVGRCILYNVE